MWCQKSKLIEHIAIRDEKLFLSNTMIADLGKEQTAWQTIRIYTGGSLTFSTKGARNMMQKRMSF